MERTRLGRTGLEVGVAGLGCGGHSRLGQSTGASVTDSVALVRAALDRGIDLIDTAQVYETEEIVGRAIAGRRDQAVLSTKLQIINPGSDPHGDDYKSPGDFVAGVEDSLRLLDTDRIDILHLHGVMPSQYRHCRENLVPVLQDLRNQGKVRFFGLTERFIADTRHDMLDIALKDDVWDVVMVGFSLINPSARRGVLAAAAERDIGVLNMFAVRRALSRPDALGAVIDSLIADGEIDAGDVDPDDPLGFLTAPGIARTLPEAAYRFCRHEQGIDVVLTGTGKIAHLTENLASINGPPLPPEILARLAGIFGAVDGVSGN